MTDRQVGINDAAIRNAATILEGAGYPGDSHKLAERIIRGAHSDGWRPIEPPVGLTGTGSTSQARTDALKAASEAVAAAKRKLQETK